ncbi:protein-glutamate O-methyltransferase CheR [Virgibacillus sp. YIM 98842]|uniref:CheR family methyltransferase n=1 Tax=Virgibacillus sp. YIM 98842 TaxID=2663533 RepID=UPI0013DD73EC|nr:protein-glutamate O-methyltransferase CheR [Virgibacillus sp. YIM 98842]
MKDDYHVFAGHVLGKTGIDLKLYKERQMKRRITSLRNKHGYHNFTAYFNALETNKDLWEEFVDRITINVSEFFRNPKRWLVLKEKILPALLKTKQTSTLTIWSAACSTGEEPYSIAMILKEYFPHINFQIIATDLDEKALEKAALGVYQEQAVKEVPDFLKEKYFTEKEKLFPVKPELKQNITFKKHNLLKDVYPQNTDLIICRNVLIYFTDDAKEYIYNHFASSLRNEGILFVGSTEQIFHPAKYHFRIMDTFFYQKVYR